MRKTWSAGLAVAVITVAIRTVAAGEIHQAARDGDAARVEALLQTEPTLLNSPDDKGRTALHVAAYVGQAEVARLLLAHGAERDLRDAGGRRAIEAAATRSRPEIVSLLLEVSSMHLGGHVHRLTLSYGLRPNSAVSAGPDGLLVVDTGHEEVAQRLDEAVRSLGNGGIVYVINTHPHGDHIGGNAVLGRDATLIAFGNLEQRASEGILARGNEPLRGRSGHSFKTWYSMRFNGEEIRLIPAPGAHSEADVLVHFVESGVMHMGDLYLSRSFPAVENVPRYLEIMDTVIDVFPPETKWIAGHGPDAATPDLLAYRAALHQTIEIVREGMKAGKTVEQMRQDDVLNQWNAWGEYLTFLDANFWIQRVHDAYVRAE